MSAKKNFGINKNKIQYLVFQSEKSPVFPSIDSSFVFLEFNIDEKAKGNQ